MADWRNRKEDENEPAFAVYALAALAIILLLGIMVWGGR